ncbi:MAG: hypothetical protein MRZ79_21700 [Bacteroidia bacterium]|nr:hypothetical protein [Bacteroidia bacterium]
MKTLPVFFYKILFSCLIFTLLPSTSLLAQEAADSASATGADTITDGIITSIVEGDNGEGIPEDGSSENSLSAYQVMLTIDDENSGCRDVLGVKVLDGEDLVDLETLIEDLAYTEIYVKYEFRVFLSEEDSVVQVLSMEKLSSNPTFENFPLRKLEENWLVKFQATVITLTSSDGIILRDSISSESLKKIYEGDRVIDCQLCRPWLGWLLFGITLLALILTFFSLGHVLCKNCQNPRNYWFAAGFFGVLAIGAGIAMQQLCLPPNTCIYFRILGFAGIVQVIFCLLDAFPCKSWICKRGKILGIKLPINNLFWLVLIYWILIEWLCTTGLINIYLNSPAS